MMKSKSIVNGWATLFMAAFLVSGAANAEVVYNNSTNNLNVRFNPGSAEVGDEIVLAGSARTVTTFVFQYWGEGFGEGETAQLRFYANNGTNAPAGLDIFVPNSLLYDSGSFSIGNTPAGSATLSFDLTGQPGGGVLVPDSFTWSVQFSGTGGAGESAGVDLFSPPTVGGNYLEYWDNAGSFDWQYRSLTIDSTNGPANFGAYIEAVPEPSGLLLGLLGGLFILGWNRARRR